jgi:hypothetical protein
MSVAPGIEIKVVWFDDDIVELEVRASNGDFSGCAQLYADRDAPNSAATTLSGFPTSSSDDRKLTLGTFDSKVAGGGARFNFRCLDGAGHPVVNVELRADPHESGEQSASFLIRCEPSALDSFVHQLKSMSLNEGSNARLNAAV